MSAPVVVRTVTHRAYDSQGRRLGHVGVVKRRTKGKIEWFGGKRFAAWAMRTVNGLQTGPAERFKTFDTEADARKHAAYAASRAP